MDINVQKYTNKTEKKQIVDTLIKSYKILEEKLNVVNQNIDNLNSELKGGLYEKGKKRKKIGPEGNKFSFSKE